MKKVLSLLLALVLCLSLCACGEGTDTPSTTDANNNVVNGQDNNTTENNNENAETPLVIRDVDGTAFVNADRYSEIIEEVIELTTNNWQDYFKTCYFDKPSGFGDVGYELVANTDRYHCFVDVSIEFKNKNTGDVVTRELDYNGCPIDENFILDDYECTNIQGYLYLVNFPEETIINSEYYGTCYKLAWGEDKNISSTSSYLEIDTRTKAIALGLDTLK